jgi:hypothetical protein
MDVSPFPVDGSQADLTVVRDLEQEFPGWSAWHSDAGRWWAFRTAADPLTFEELSAGRRLIVRADTVEALRLAIRAELELPG